MRVESYDRHMLRTCGKCYTLFDLKRDYCCAKSKDECFADLGLVRRGILQDVEMRRRLFRRKKIDSRSDVKSKKFFRGVFRNECLVFNYRPPGCRSHFCSRWDKYMDENPIDFVFANLRIVPKRKMLAEFRKEFEYGIKLAYPGGFIIFTDDPSGRKKEMVKLFRDMKIKHFVTDSELMDPEDNEKDGVEIIMDRDAVIEKPRLFGTLIKNNTFMLVRMKMNMGSTGFGHSNLMITTADPQNISKETHASLKAFHALKAYSV